MSDDRQILAVIDDNEATRYMTAKLLSEAGFEVHEAATGGEGLELVTEVLPDVVVLDVRLPDMHGFEVCQKIKENPLTHLTPVIHVSATWTEIEYKVEGLDRGADAYLTRPVAPTELVATIRAMARMKRALEALRDSEYQTRQLFDGSPLPSFAYDRGSLAILDVNEAAIRRYGYSRAELVGMSIDALGAGFTLNSKQPGNGHSNPDRVTLVHTTRDGREIEVEVTNREAGYQGHDAILSVIVDVTERNQHARERARLEGELGRAQKMEAIGRLAGGIAHDFNNLLTVILGQAEFITEELPETSPLRNDLQAITDAGRRAESLVRQLLIFSRRGEATPEVIDLPRLCQKTSKMLRRLVPENIDMTFSSEPRPMLVEIDPAQAEEILVNLVLNARDSMPRGGVIRIGLTYEPPESHEGSATGWARLAVLDTGPGIDPEQREHIFEPFFSTKERASGRGVGLGLATVFGAVTGAGGTIDIDSTPGIGTDFRVRLPVSPQVRPDEANMAPPADIALSGLRILVAEDEPMLRQIVSRMLDCAGCSVTASADGREAIAAGEAKLFDLLVADVIMPGYSGKEVAEKLQIPTVFISGHTDSIISENGSLPKGQNFLRKPFSSEQLTRAMTEALFGKEAFGDSGPN